MNCELKHNYYCTLRKITINTVNSSWGGFDTASHCIQPAGNPPWDACCGEYPDRTPYSTESSKSCCATRLFDKSIHQCCADSVVPSGATCNA